jgi:hypothetical protein
MKKIVHLALVSTIAVTTFAASASAEQNYRRRDQYRPHMNHGKTTVDVNAGIRRNQFDWNIASDITGTATPNVLSELTWKDIDVLEVKGHVRHLKPASNRILRGSVMIEGELTAGLTVSGENQDSDWNGDNRTQEFSRSNNASNGGYAFGASAAAGYQFNVAQKIRPQSTTYFTVTPFAGYGWTRQKYEMTNGFQTIPANGAFGGLNSEYIADWYGPFAGIEAQLEHNRHLLTVRGEKHQLSYDAEADWNLRTDFRHDPSYTHTAEDGDGVNLKVGYSYAIDSAYDVTLDYDYVKREAKNGVDTTFFSNGTVLTTRVNEVNDKSQALRLGLKYYYDK